MEFIRLYKYAVQILGPQNTESGEPELKNVGDKYQDKTELIIHETIINAGWNQVTNMIQWFAPLFQDSQKMSLVCISTLSLSWEKIISLYLFKRIAYDKSGLPLRKQVSRMIKFLPPMIELIQVSWMLKLMHVELFTYL